MSGYKCPDWAVSDLHLYNPLKGEIQGNYFCSDDEDIVLDTRLKSFFQEMSQKLIKRLTKCIEVGEDYDENTNKNFTILFDLFS